MFPLTLNLGEHQAATAARLRQWQADGAARRLWNRDHRLWSAEPQPELTDRLGWLDSPVSASQQVEALTDFAAEVQGAGFRHVLLLGMGGSSLAPAVYQAAYGNRPGHPPLLVLDSTHPQAIGAAAGAVDPAATLVLVSSKSGTTTETQVLCDYWWQRLVTAGISDPGHHFVAITDPGTPLEQLAGERGFRRVWTAPPDVGGRYAALTVFGLVPAALIGLDLNPLVDGARAMGAACGPAVPATANPGLQLGAALGELARAGRDKVTFFISPGIAAFGAWVEQLLAESTGKDRQGIVPVVDEPPGSPAGYGSDRVFVCLRRAGEDNAAFDALLPALEAAGHPTIRIDIPRDGGLGPEFFRWMVATAAAGAVLGVHPFNQPDVQRNKRVTAELLSAFARTGALPAAETVPAGDLSAWRAFLARARAGDYVALQAYLAPTAATAGALQALRAALRDGLGVATTVGFGPRFLHSTGQLHKGGPDSGLCVQLVDGATPDLPVPGQAYSFGALIQAQSLGDYAALQERGRRVLRLRVGVDPAAELARLATAAQATGR